MDTLNINEIEHVLGRAKSQTITIQEISIFLDVKQLLITEHLVKWKHNQHLALYGDRTFVENGKLVFCQNEQDLSNAQRLHLGKLNEIQTWLDGLVSIIGVTLIAYINRGEFAVEIEKIIEILKSLVSSSLIVQEQPLQVYKAKKK